MNTTKTVETFLSQAQVGEPISHERLTLFPIRLESSDDGFPYLLMDEAVDSELLKIGEIGGGHVPELKLESSADMSVLILDGQELTGAKQNRILNTSIVVKAGSSVVIPVTCVEQGRWTHTSRWMSHGGISYPELRAAKAQYVHESLRRDRSYHSDQGQVWNKIGQKLTRMKVSSHTSSMREIYEAHQARLSVYTERLKYPGETFGIVVAIGEQLVCADIFDRPQTLQKLWPKLVESYAMDAVDRPDTNGEAPSVEAVRTFLEPPVGVESYESPGAGTSVRFEDVRRRGSVLLHSGSVLHLQIFAQIPEREEVAGPARGGQMPSRPRPSTPRPQATRSRVTLHGVDEAVCPHCGKRVQPTFHGLCPDCEEVIVP